jgi:hypothetical protein
VERGMRLMYGSDEQAHVWQFSVDTASLSPAACLHRSCQLVSFVSLSRGTSPVKRARMRVVRLAVRGVRAYDCV